ncbi:hypothetical protein M3Y97_01052600 [Aphelenchoides bicaudatus]|nr:hypothetical protein M3Y97_01052600 [Aphelenchoides bicaudatus]
MSADKMHEMKQKLETLGGEMFEELKVMEERAKSAEQRNEELQKQNDDLTQQLKETEKRLEKERKRNEAEKKKIERLKQFFYETFGDNVNEASKKNGTSNHLNSPQQQNGSLKLPKSEKVDDNLHLEKEKQPKTPVPEQKRTVDVKYEPSTSPRNDQISKKRPKIEIESGGDEKKRNKAGDANKPEKRRFAMKTRQPGHSKSASGSSTPSSVANS